MPDIFLGPIAIRPSSARGRGRGIFATRAVAADEPLCADFCLEFDAADAERLRATLVGAYHFQHPSRDNETCLVMGPISFANHVAGEASCRLHWVEDGLGWTVTLVARVAIPAGGELTIDYGYPPWFEVA